MYYNSNIDLITPKDENKGNNLISTFQYPSNSTFLNHRPSFKRFDYNVLQV